MAVKTVSSAPLHMQCLSSDNKPSAEDGSTMHIIDTGEQLICHEGIWSPDLRIAKAIKMAALI